MDPAIYGQFQGVTHTHFRPVIRCRVANHGEHTVDQGGVRGEDLQGLQYPITEKLDCHSYKFVCLTYGRYNFFSTAEKTK